MDQLLVSWHALATCNSNDASLSGILTNGINSIDQSLLIRWPGLSINYSESDRSRVNWQRARVQKYPDRFSYVILIITRDKPLLHLLIASHITKAHKRKKNNDVSTLQNYSSTQNSSLVILYRDRLGHFFVIKDDFGVLDYFL